VWLDGFRLPQEIRLEPEEGLGIRTVQ
jgi:hypothetical protein